jgi:predicted dienelactone hydrolase
MKKLIVTLLAIFAGCSSRAELDWSVEEPGKHGVGFREAHLIYKPSAGLKEGETERVLRLAIWYPTAATTGKKAKYLDLERDKVFVDAPPEGEDLPVMIYSHGRWAFAEVSGFLPEHFASHGFVVVAPDHAGDTIEQLTQPLTTEVYLLRPLDVSAVIDFLRDLSPRDPLFGRIGEQVVTSGHSFGGYTVFASAGARFPIDPGSCAGGEAPRAWCTTMRPELASRFTAGFVDPRIQAAISLAPGSADVLGPSGVSAIEIPVLLATGGMDQQVDGESFWPPLDGPSDRWISMARAGHHSFTHACELLPGYGEEDGCGENAVPSAEAHRLVAAYSLAFARLHLFGDTSVAPILDGERVLSPEVVLTKK